MYTEENMEYNDNYEDNNKNSSIWTLLLRVVIIFVCLLLVIWLISKFIGGKKIENDGKVFNSNLDTIRLASEKYFFIDNNLPQKENETLTIGLSDMNNQGMFSTIKDYQGNVCSSNSNESFASLTKTSVAYELKIKLTCAEEQKEITYYYDLEDYECLSCSGNTYMDGNLSFDDESNSTDKEDSSENNSSTDSNVSVDDLDISCDKWSEWTTIKIDDKRLLVRTRTLYKGYKQTTDGINTIYGEWSNWSETPVVKTETLDVEIKQEVRSKDNWSANKTTTDYSLIKDKIANGTVKVISENTSSSGGYYKSVVKTGEVSASKYQSLKSQGLVISVLDTYYKTECSEECKTCYTKVYKIKYTDKQWISGSKVTTYTYQEKETITETVNLYRYRTITKEVVKGEIIYTDWVEKLEEGYIKTEEKTEYSYKDTSCKG